MKYLVFIIALFAALQTNAQNNIVYGAGINYTNGAPTFTPPVRTSRVAIDTVTGKWYHFNTPGGWQWIGNTVEEISGCAAPAYTPDKGDSRLVVNNCAKPQVYWYDGAVWKWINEGEVYTAGEGIRIESNTIILDSLYVLRFRTGSNTDGAAGTMSWNTTEETVDLVTDQGSVTGHLLESAYYNTRNTTGSSITIGTVVMANGTTGNTGRILITPAIADGSVNSEYILGLTAQAIGNNANGKVQHFGKVRGIQTNGANYGETWVDGDVLYCSAVTPGYLTKVLPTAPNLKVPIAIVIHAHPSNGTLFVRPSHFPDLAQINDVELSSPTNGQVLTYNSTLSRWENATPANQLQTLSTDNTPGNISISSGNTITLNVNDADASATNELQTLSVAANTATLSNSGGSVTIAGAGINTVGTAGTTITVTGTEVDGSITNELQTLSTGTNTLTLSNGGGTVTVDTDPSTDITGSGTATQIAYFTGAQTVTSESALQWDAVNDQLGIGTAPSAKLQIQSSTNGSEGIYIRNSNTGNAAQSYIGVFNNASEGANFISYGTNHAAWPNAVNFFTSSNSISQLNFIARNHRIGFWTNITERMRILATGEVGINQTAPAARLHVVGSGTSSSTWTAQFHNSAGNNNALMIRDDGNVGIGTTTMTGRLNITDNGSYGIYQSGTAPNYFLGSIGIGQTNLTGHNLYIRKDLTGATTVYGIRSQATLKSDVTTAAHGVYSLINTDPGSFTVPNVYYFRAEQGVFDVGSSVTNQYGFHVNNTLSGADNDYGFWSGLNSGSGRWNFYANGTARNYFAGNTAIGTTTQNASAAFEVASTTQGVLFPRMTTAQRDLIATPADGLVIYNTTDNKLQVRAGGAWVDLH